MCILSILIGRRAAYLGLERQERSFAGISGDGKIVTTTPSAFDEQLKVCRAE
jgi:hypothetical protein